MRIKSLWGIAVCILLGPIAAQAEIKLPKVIGDHMVLQRRQAIPVWGWDEPGTKMAVVFDGKTATTTADDQGKWMVSLPAHEAGGPFNMVIEGTNRVELKDILVGEVWLCSGQSNMEWRVRQALNPEAEIKAANHPRIRHIKVEHVPAAQPMDDVKSNGWKVCSPETVADFTAVGYYFGRSLLEELDVPIGLLGSNWGGTRIEPWTPPAGFKAVDELKDISQNLDKYPQVNNGKVNHQSALALYNGMIHPLVPYGIKGAIWYQGESNNGEGMAYFHKMRALIHGWRAVWKNDELPFYYVQLAPFVYGRRNPTDLAGIWEAQTQALSIPHTGMAVTVDIGNVRDIHPKNKQEVGRRLALWALAKNYGKSSLVYSGPLFREAKREGASLLLHFDHVAGGLTTRDGKAPSHFEVAGANGEFVAAEARIRDSMVVVSAASVEEPVHVRYAWDQAAEPNLSNQAGLPASPFRAKVD